MSIVTLGNLPQNRFASEIKDMQTAVRELRTKQVSGSDTTAPITADVVITSDYTLAAPGVWEDVTGLTVDLTITEPSYIIVYMSCLLYWAAFLGSASLMEARMVWDGSATGSHAKFFAGPTPTVLTDLTNVQQCVLITENTAGTYTLKMQAIGHTDPLIVGDDTNFAYFVFRQ